MTGRIGHHRSQADLRHCHQCKATDDALGILAGILATIERPMAEEQLDRLIGAYLYLLNDCGGFA